MARKADAVTNRESGTAKMASAKVPKLVGWKMVTSG